MRRLKANEVNQVFESLEPDLSEIQKTVTKLQKPQAIPSRVKTVIAALLECCDDDAKLARLALTDEDHPDVEEMLEDHEGEVDWLLGYLRGYADSVGVKANSLVRE